MPSVSTIKNAVIGLSTTAMLTCAAPKIPVKAVEAVLPDLAPKVEDVLIKSEVAKGLRNNLLYGVPAGASAGGAIGFLTSIGTQVKDKKKILQHTIEGASTGAQLSTVTGSLLSTMITAPLGVAVSNVLQNFTALTVIMGSKRLDEQTLRIAEEQIKKNAGKIGKNIHK